MMKALQFVFDLFCDAPKPALQAKPPARPQRANGDDALHAKACELLTAIGLRELAAQITVRWNPRMRSTAGTADYRKQTITLNPRLAEFGDEEIDRTLRHELAHLVARHRNPRRRIAPHGAEWRRACADLGIQDESVRHTLPLPRRKLARPHLYICPSCRVEVRRVRPFRRAVACLACCRAYNGGRFDERFRFEKMHAARAAATPSSQEVQAAPTPPDSVVRA
jgi:predicted SprT family Zn-dependent metalloprotease